jgi:hypothetical protein
MQNDFSKCTANGESGNLSLHTCFPARMSRDTWTHLCSHAQMNQQMDITLHVRREVSDQWRRIEWQICDCR